jgi:acetolactate synthase-1/2/3 large subunit
MEAMPDGTRTVARLLLDYLRLEGVDHIFGVPGGGLIQMLWELYAADDQPRYVVCRHETGAAYMADGYYRVSGRLGVVMVTTGPGATNALTGVMNAEAAGSAMLALTGEIAQMYYGSGYLQEGIDGKLDVDEVFRAACAASAVLSTADNAPRLIESALRTALGTPRHAAHLSLPVDVTMATVAPGSHPTPDSPARYRASAPVAPAAQVSDTVERLAAARRPMILLGNGCREALRDPATRAAFTGLVEAAAIPVMTTADGKSVFPEDHPMALGAFGIANAVWPYYWMTQTDPAYDLLLVIGSGLGELATDKWQPMLRPAGTMIQVDAESRVIARDYPVDLGITGEAGDFIRRLVAEAPSVVFPADVVAARRAFLAGIKTAHDRFADPDAYRSEAAPIHPAALCRVMQEVMPAEGSIVMLDAGNCVGWGVHYLTGGPGFEIHSSLDMGPMGFAVGAVVGAKLARPEATCVALTGDGAFMMQGAEISTAQRLGIGAIWIVLQDNDLAMVSQGMEHFKKGDLDRWRAMFSLGDPDLAAFATGLGAQASTVDSPAAFRDALGAALCGAAEGRPQVIVARIDRNAQPPYYNPLYTPPKPHG